MTDHEPIGATLADPETGQFGGRPLAGNAWLAPHVVELDAKHDRLIWRIDSGYVPRQPGPGLLDDFVGLADAPPERICTYARRWGVLRLCEHGLPSAHNPTRAIGPRRWPEPPPPRFVRKGRTWRQVYRRGELGRVLEGCHPLPVHPDGREWWRAGEYWEPLAVWRRYARLARALLNLAAELHEGRKGRPEDWRIVTPQWGDQPPSWWLESVGGCRDFVARQITKWLDDVAGGRLTLTWSRLGMRVSPGPSVSWSWSDESPAILTESGLFGALGLQLMLVIARSDGLAHCSGCGTAYPAKRRPRAGQRRYCQDCRERGVPLRDAKRDERTRRTRARGRRRTAGGPQPQFRPAVPGTDEGPRRPAGRGLRASPA